MLNDSILQEEPHILNNSAHTVENQDKTRGEGFLNLIRKKKNKNLAVDGLPVVNLDHSFDMEEINTADSIPIQRSSSIKRELVQKTKIKRMKNSLR
jgi:hypothetical protein